MLKTLSTGLSGHARRVTALVLARFSAKADLHQMDRWLIGLPAPRRRRIVALVLGLLLALSLLASAFGPLGLAVYFGAVVILFRPR